MRELDGQYCVTDGDTVVFSFGDLEVLDSFTGADEATDDWDAHRTIASINVQTIQANNKYVITLTVDEDFLTAPGTVYPVYIDPSFNVQSTYIKDTFISEGSPSGNYGNNTELKLGYGASSKRNRVLVQFTNMINGVNRPGLTPSTINSAKYYMYCTTTYTSTPYVDAYMIPLGVTEWSDTSATWNNAAASTLNSAVLQGSTRVGSSGWYNFDVTNAYTSWFNALRSRGLMFKMRIESATENYYRHFASANYTANSGRLPYLAVNYGTGISMLLSPTSAYLSVGQTQQLATSIYPITVQQGVTWTSSNTSVATVSSTGKITAKASGTATITARSVYDPTIYKTCAVQVIVPVSKIELNRTNRVIKVGKTFSLVSKITPSNASIKSITWSSSNNNVATVNSNGVVAALTTGTATITATTLQGNKQASCVITVNTLNNIYIRVFYDGSFEDTYGNNAENVIADLMNKAKIPFLQKWNINLIAEPMSIYDVYAGLPSDSCSWQQGSSSCINLNCGHSCSHSGDVSICKCGYTLYNIISSQDIGTYDLQTCFVTYNTCVGGLGGVGGISTIVMISPTQDTGSETYMGSVRRIQHELSHNFGTTHNGEHEGIGNDKYCTAGSHCINNSGFDTFAQIVQDDKYDLPTIWCTRCALDFDSGKFN